MGIRDPGGLERPEERWRGIPGEAEGREGIPRRV